MSGLLPTSGVAEKIEEGNMRVQYCIEMQRHGRRRGPCVGLLSIIFVVCIIVLASVLSSFGLACSIASRNGMTDGLNKTELTGTKFICTTIIILQIG